MPLILFNTKPQNPNLTLPRIHPLRPERPGDPFPSSDVILLSVQEGNILRVAMYYPEMDELGPVNTNCQNVLHGLTLPYEDIQRTI